MKARDVMTQDPVTVTPRATVAEAWELMSELDIRHVPVVEAGVLVGMLSDRDLARFDLVRLLTVEGPEVFQRELATPVVRVMSADVVVVQPETELGEVIELLIEHKIGAVPVVKPDTREIVGIVSYVDVLRALRDSIAEE
jgi:acetoin utilization protein AcuB